MKVAALILALASPAFAAGFYPNDIGGSTLLLDTTHEACRDMRVALAQDETGRVRHHGCWTQHVHSVVIFWDIGRASVVPTTVITWDEKLPAPPAPGPARDDKS